MNNIFHLGAPEDLPGDLPPLPTDVALCDATCSFTINKLFAQKLL